MMSDKAYLFRLRTKQDIDDLNKLFQALGDVMFFSNLYKPTRKIKEFKKTDLVVAITVDRADLKLAFYEEAGVKKTKHLYFKRLEEILYNLVETKYGFRVSDWDVLKAHDNTTGKLPPEAHWIKIAKDYLVNGKNINNLIWRLDDE